MGAGFFSKPQGAAIFKHATLSKYLPVFLGKLGPRAIDKRVVFLDGYAGEGQYSDGTEGSPLIAAQIGEQMAKSRGLRLDVICVERERATAKRLRATMEPFGERVTVLQGPLMDHIDHVLDLCGKAPLLAFLDPFGMGAPMAKLKEILGRDPNGSIRTGIATEILMNLSLAGLQRNAGKLTSKATAPQTVRAMETTVAQMDDWMGGDWWRELWLTHRDLDPEEAWRLIVNRYVQDLAAGRGWYITSASDSWKGPAAYLLALFTQRPDGLWAFNAALSYARRAHYDFSQKIEESKAGAQGTLGLDLFAAEDDGWVREITDRLEGLLKEGPVVVKERIGDILGKQLGWARDTHVRTAIKALFKAGKTTCDGKGDVLDLTIRPT